MHQLIRRSLIALTLTAAVFTGCTKKGQSIEVETAAGEKLKLEATETLRINVTSEPPSLDWHKATDTTSSTITDNIMEGLVQYDLNDKELGLLPGLAVKWTPDAAAKVWKLQLREGVQWSDGQPFTAQHVIDGFQRLLAKETASEYAYFLFPIKNAQAFNEGKVDFAQVGAKITGPLEITVELDKSMSYFPYLLTHHSTYPARLDVIQKHGDKWTEPGNIVTLGPFNLRVWQHDKMIVLERNEKYYGEKTLLKNVAIYMIGEQATAINLFDSGKLDAVESLPSVELRKLKERKEFRQFPRLSVMYYGINVAKPPMNNALVRKAIASAIDRQQVVQMLAGGQMPMTSWIPSGVMAYEAERGTAFNPEKAKEYLKQAGFTDPAKFPKIELKFNTNEDHQRVAENVQAQLKKNLGIDVELKNEEWKVYLSTLKSDPPHMYRFGWQADYPDPDNFMTIFTGFAENNRTRWKNAKYDELVVKGAGEVNRDERKKIYSEAQKILVEDEVPMIPVYSSVGNMLVSPRLKNYPANAMGKLVFKNTSIAN